MSSSGTSSFCTASSDSSTNGALRADTCPLFRRKPKRSSPPRTWTRGLRSAWTTLATTTSPSTRTGGSSNGQCCLSGPSLGQGVLGLASAQRLCLRAGFFLLIYKSTTELLEKACGSGCGSSEGLMPVGGWVREKFGLAVSYHEWQRHHQQSVLALRGSREAASVHIPITLTLCYSASHMFGSLLLSYELCSGRRAGTVPRQILALISPV